MIEINLLPEELRKKEAVKIALPEIPIKKTLYMVGGGVLGLQILLTLYTGFLQLQHQSLSRQVSVLQESAKDIIRMKSETTGIYNRLKEAREVSNSKFYWSSLLSALSNHMTKGVWLRGLSVTEEEPRSASDKKEPQVVPPNSKKSPKNKYLVLEGSAVGQGQETAFIGKFLKQLKDSDFFSNLFSDIKPYNINQRRIKDFDVFDFTINCKFKKDKI